MSTMTKGQATLARHCFKSIQDRTGWLGDALVRHAKRGYMSPEEARRGQELLEEIEMMYMGALMEADETLGER
ncbi:MAG: hypothetical protein ACREIS_08205 [Nitrospiraceae bacterium]